MESKIKILFGTIIAILLSFSVMSVQTYNGGENEKTSLYHKIRLINPSHESVMQCARAGMAVDEWRPNGKDMIAFVSDQELEHIRLLGLAYQILIQDYSRYVEQRNLRDMENIGQLQESMRKHYRVEGFKFGSMGGHLTYDQMRYEIDTMMMKYPNLITMDPVFGYTIDGNYILAYKITSNAFANDTNKTDVMYNGLIHAREPMSMMSLIYFMYYLLENYGRDPEVTYLLDHRNLWFIPCLNPDGYKYNQSTNPNGGGMWRKNRWIGANGTRYGVDLNRNFGYMWGYDNLGSSPDSNQETFRGRWAFSEKESQFVRNFCLARKIKTQVDGHTYGHYFMYPWAYINQMCPDSVMYIRMAQEITQNTTYIYGYSGQLLGYNSNGSARDWEYGEQTAKEKIFAYTTEIGTSSDDFWAPIGRIYPLCQELLNPYLYIAWAGGKWVMMENFVFNKTTYAPGDSGTLKIMLRNKGVTIGFPATYSLTSPQSGISFVDASGIKTFTQFRQRDTLTMKFYIADTVNTSGGFVLNFELKCGSFDLLKRTYTIAFGTPEIIFSDDAEGGMGNWMTGGSVGGLWNTTTSTYRSPTKSFTDSPSGNYAKLCDLRMATVALFNLTEYTVVHLNFWQRFATQNYHDYCDVEVSTNSGAKWFTVDHYAGSNTAWHEKTVDLSRWVAGKNNVKIRFRLTSNDTIQDDGWYIDDISLRGYRSPTAISIDDQETGIYRFALESNYPNPFNPSTTIRFYLKESGYVTLKIYNILGQEIRTLIDGYQGRGERKALWDGKNAQGKSVSSGVYFYRLEAVTPNHKFSQSRKMMLMK